MLGRKFVGVRKSTKEEHFGWLTDPFPEGTHLTSFLVLIVILRCFCLVKGKIGMYFGGQIVLNCLCLQLTSRSACISYRISRNDKCMSCQSLRE